MPGGRFKKLKTPQSVPNVGDPDRKRVLNVLAQRRYRQRQREKIEALKAQTQSQRSATATTLPLHNKKPLFELDTSTESCLIPETDSLEEVENVCRLPDSTLSIFGLDDDQFNLNMMEGLHDFTCLPTPIPSSPSSSSATPRLSLPIPSDGAVLNLPILNAIYAFKRIANALDIVSHLWDPCHLHILPKSIPALEFLPKNLHPTPAQHTIPHHPVLDLLPWPNVREKLICILSLPSSLRPPVAREEVVGDSPSSSPAIILFPSPSPGGMSEMSQSGAIMQLVQDMDDLQDGGGLRVHGNTTTWNEGNELVEDAWEVGSLFYSKWWWCLDQKIIETSNKRRRERGLERLKLIA